MNPDYLRSLSAERLAQLIRDRKTSSRAVVAAHVEHAKAVNPKLNAIVADRFEAALAEADEADEAASRGDDLGALHGVPCTIKECIAVEGMPQSGGVVARRDFRSTQDATVVKRLRQEGAIVLGVTNVSELCMWMESINKVYGRTNNAHDLKRTAGGSSGGEGAIVASGASPFGVGTDVGGSVRMPSFFNGIFGHKPSGGLVPGTGQWPFAETEAGLRIWTTGPLCRRASDLPLLLDILAGPDGEDIGCRHMALGDAGSVNIAELRVLHLPDNGAVEVTSELREAQLRALQVLEELGAKIERPEIPALKHSEAIWGAMLAEATPRTYSEWMEIQRPLVELGRWSLRGSEHTLPSIGLAIMHRALNLRPKLREDMVRLGTDLRDELAYRLGDDGVMLYPPYSRPAPRHHAPLMLMGHWAYCAIFNAMELPSTAVPLGLNERGLPLGAQVVASHGNDHLTMAVAQALERKLGGWSPPRPRG